MSPVSQMSLRTPDGYPIPNVWHRGQPGTANGDIVVMSHGIFSDKDERGRYVRQAAIHLHYGADVVRFDFRGHGAHVVPSENVTISGMMLDFATVLREARALAERRLLVVASSFGASILLLYLQTLDCIRPDRIVFLNPVVDYRATMVEASLEWGENVFGARARAELESTGCATLEQGFKMQPAMFYELCLFRPYDAFKDLSIPTRVLHGDRDSKVPYEVTRAHAEKGPSVDFHTVEGSDHAFKPNPHEVATFDLVTDWLYGGVSPCS